MRELWKNALLVLGAALVVAAAWVTLTHLTDRTIFAVLVPGFIAGLAMIGTAMYMGRGPRHGTQR